MTEDEKTRTLRKAEAQGKDDREGVTLLMQKGNKSLLKSQCERHSRDRAKTLLDVRREYADDVFYGNTHHVETTQTAVVTLHCSMLKQ